MSFENRKRRDLSFQMGEKLFIKLHPHRQLSVDRRPCLKLAPRFFGPFEILAHIGAVAYRLRLPAGSHIHPIFHVSQLRRVVGEHATTDHIPIDVDLSGEASYYPAKILDRSCLISGDPASKEVLVAWANHPDSDATWLPRDDFLRQFTDYCLEDKTHFPDDGIVTGVHVDETLWRVYTRRRSSSSSPPGAEGTEGA